MEEYGEILKRDFEHNEEEKDERIKELIKILIIVFPKEKIEFIKVDSDDDKVLEGAVEANADFIVSYDHHLLDLEKFREIIILKPEETLRKI